MLKGAITALVTPFIENTNSINYKKFLELIDFQIKNKIDGLVICGTTGESATLSDTEKNKLIRYAVKRVKGLIPVIAGTGSNNTDHAIKLAKEAQNSGADYLLVVTPYYNKTSQDGIYEHFKAISDSTTLPIILYNVPSRTGVDISVDTIIKLAEIENIIGIKEASSDITKFEELILKKPNDFLVFSGNDDMIVPTMSIGANGVISVLSNAFPADVKKMCDACLNMDYNYAKTLQLNFFNMIKLLFIEPNPIPIKSLLNLLDFDVGSLRLPLVTASEETYEKLKSELFKIEKN